MQPEKEDWEFVSVTRDGRIATVRFDRDDGLNALSAAAMRELTAVAGAIDADTNINVVVLSGTDSVFSAGADLKDRELADRATRGLLEQRQALRVGPDMCAAWEALEQITICAVEGFCIGGGVALAAACDLRTAGRSANFRLPEVPLGMNMSWRSNPRLVGLMGPALAKKFVILGEKLSADKALEWGLIEQVCDDGEACSEALALARRFAELPPVPVRMSKQSINAASNALNYTASFMDRDQFALTAGSKDQREAIEAFLEKRKPVFTGE